MQYFNSSILFTLLYMKKSNLDTETLKQLLALDKYLDAETCLKYGLIDNID